MALTKAAKDAIENASVLITGQDMDLAPQERVQQAGLPHRYTSITLQVKISDDSRYSLGYRYHDIAKKVFDVMVVDGEVVMKAGSLWATGWHGNSGEENAGGREKALLPKLVATCEEAQAYSDSLGRKPPGEAEILRTMVERDLARLTHLEGQVRYQARKLEGCTHAELENIKNGLDHLLCAIFDEELRLDKLIGKEE